MPINEPATDGPLVVSLADLMPGAASRKRATSSGLKTNRGLARLMYGRQVPAEVGTIKRHLEKNRGAEIVVLILGTPAPLDVRCN